MRKTSAPKSSRKNRENQPPEGGEVPPEAVEQPVQTVPLVFNGQQILLPADAVQALTGALGANPVELLQKGMNYDRKAEREMRVLDQYAEAAGMNRQQYLEQLEGARNEQLLSAEIGAVPRGVSGYAGRGAQGDRRGPHGFPAGGRGTGRRTAAGASLPPCSSALIRLLNRHREEADASSAWEEYVSLSGVTQVSEDSAKTRA